MGYILVAGWHRLMAIRQLEHDSIQASVLDGIDADQAELAEIDENLIRADLTQAERKLHTGKRAQLWQKLHGSPKAKGAHAAHKKMGHKHDATATVADAFTTETARKTGRSSRTVRRDVQHANDVVVLEEIVGTCLDNEHEIQALAKLPVAEQHKLAKAIKTGKKVSAKTRVKQLKRQEREQGLAQKQLTFPTKKYNVILEDYEWDFEVFSRETGMDRHAANHYPVSEDAHTPQEIVQRTAQRFECAADDCVLFMCATVPHLAIAIDVLRLRGFRYVTNFVWDKIDTVTGYWNRNRHEHLLIGVKGEIPCPAPGEQWESLFSERPGAHSVKPEHIHKLIEAYFPNLPKIELNRRGPPRPGWDAWGNEAEPASILERFAEHHEPQYTSASSLDQH
jgi:N6-adenosine-specific RNA methylase IME4